jgi:hypothetical protein
MKNSICWWIHKYMRRYDEEFFSQNLGMVNVLTKQGDHTSL